LKGAELKIALLGRSSLLLNTGKRLHNLGHSIKLIGTAHAEEYYDTKVEDLESFANDIGAIFFEEKNINSEKIIAQLKESGAEIGVSVNWPFILGEGICEALSFGILNGHTGDLPRYRGNATPNWAILNGEDKIGLCVHIMEPNRIDSGPILTRDFMEITKDSYIEDIYNWMNRKLPELFSESINGLAEGTIIPEPQSGNPDLSLRCYPRRPDDNEIDWKDSSENIHRLVRASSRPFSGAFTTLERVGRLTIWRAEKFEHPGDFFAVPGQILFNHEEDPIVACGSGALRLTDIFLEGVESSLAKKEVGRSLRSRLINS
jgi:methionyl-tRNA formyltransferase